MAVEGVQSVRPQIQEEPEGFVPGAPDQLHPHRVADAETGHQCEVRAQDDVRELPSRAAAAPRPGQAVHPRARATVSAFITLDAAGARQAPPPMLLNYCFDLFSRPAQTGKQIKTRCLFDFIFAGFFYV